MLVLACKRQANIEIASAEDQIATLHIHRMFLDNVDQIHRVELSLTMYPDCPAVRAAELPYKRPKGPTKGGRGKKILLRFNDTICVGEDIEIVMMGSGSNSPERYAVIGFRAPEDVIIHQRAPGPSAYGDVLKKMRDST